MQGTAVGGIGILIDRAGKDDYHAAMWAQGVGGPLGFGLLDDLQGADHYYCGGQWRNSYYPETPGMEGWGQGAGEAFAKLPTAASALFSTVPATTSTSSTIFPMVADTVCGLGFARDFGGQTIND